MRREHARVSGSAWILEMRAALRGEVEAIPQRRGHRFVGPPRSEWLRAIIERPRENVRAERCTIETRRVERVDQAIAIVVFRVARVVNPQRALRIASDARKRFGAQALGERRGFAVRRGASP